MHVGSRLSSYILFSLSSALIYLPIQPSFFVPLSYVSSEVIYKIFFFFNLKREEKYKSPARNTKRFSGLKQERLTEHNPRPPCLWPFVLDV